MVEANWNGISLLLGPYLCIESVEVLLSIFIEQGALKVHRLVDSAHEFVSMHVDGYILHCVLVVIHIPPKLLLVGGSIITLMGCIHLLICYGTKYNYIII